MSCLTSEIQDKRYKYPMFKWPPPLNENRTMLTTNAVQASSREDGENEKAHSKDLRTKTKKRQTKKRAREVEEGELTDDESV